MTTDLQALLLKYGIAAVAAIGAFLAAVVVLCMTIPRTMREWVVALISTVVSSIAGGAAVIQRFEMQSWMTTSTGLVAVLGLVFACGMPGWAVVRWAFNFIEKRKDKGLDEVAGEIRDSVKSLRE